MEEMIARIRKDFPTLVLNDEGKSPIHYLDNAATTLKPQVVLEAMDDYYINYPSNIHRGGYDFSEKATAHYEKARQTVASFLGVSDPSEIIFTAGTTHSTNLLSRSFVRTLKKGDEIIVTSLEHNSNLINWQMMAKEYGITCKVLPFHWEHFRFDLGELQSLLSPHTKAFIVTALSNTLGVAPPLKEMIALCKAQKTRVFVDIAQASAHMPLKLEDLGIDAAYFSGHKVFGPTGIGVLYGKMELLETLAPAFYGGGMVSAVKKDDIVLAPIPTRFEAGTPPIAQAIGLGRALEYVNTITWQTIMQIEEYLTQKFKEHIASLPFITLYPPLQTQHSFPVFSFNVDGVHPHDVGSILNEAHVAVRTGYHCTHSLFCETGVSGTVRASFSFYNNLADILALKEALQTVWKVFHG